MADELIDSKDYRVSYSAMQLMAKVVPRDSKEPHKWHLPGCVHQPACNSEILANNMTYTESPAVAREIIEFAENFTTFVNLLYLDCNLDDRSCCDRQPHFRSPSEELDTPELRIPYCLFDRFPAREQLLLDYLARLITASQPDDERRSTP